MKLRYRNFNHKTDTVSHQKLSTVSSTTLNVMTALFVSVILLRASGNVPGEHFASHISNFGFTGAGMLVLARSSWLRGFTKRWLLGQAALFAAVNLIVELAVNVDDIRLGTMVFVNFNTADPLDALFGLAAVAVVVGYASTFMKPVTLTPLTSKSSP